MKYYLIDKELTEELNLTGIRNKCSDGRYIVNSSDLAPLGTDKIVSKQISAEEISLADAKKLLKK